jgi:hypothetical protein
LVAEVVLRVAGGDVLRVISIRMAAQLSFVSIIY